MKYLVYCMRITVKLQYSSVLAESVNWFWIKSYSSFKKSDLSCRWKKQPSRLVELSYV